MERQIKPSKNSKYNMNFIDWNNEWERVSEVQRKIENNEQVSDDEEYKRVKNYLDNERIKNGVQLPKETVLSKKEVEKLIKSNKPKECYICFKEFIEKTVVMKLPCSHIFDSLCLIPWLENHSTCPTCKFDLKPKQEDDDENLDY